MKAHQQSHSSIIHYQIIQTSLVRFMNLFGIVLHNLTFICFYVFSQNKQARKTRLCITDQRVSPICLCITTEHENDSISTSRKMLLLQVTIQHEQPPRIQSDYTCTSKIWKWQYLLSMQWMENNRIPHDCSKEPVILLTHTHHSTSAGMLSEIEQTEQAGVPVILM